MLGKARINAGQRLMESASSPPSHQGRRRPAAYRFVGLIDQPTIFLLPRSFMRREVQKKPDVRASGFYRRATLRRAPRGQGSGSARWRDRQCM